MRVDVETQDATHVDVGVRDRSDAGEMGLIELIGCFGDDSVDVRAFQNITRLAIRVRVPEIATSYSDERPWAAEMGPSWIARCKVWTASPWASRAWIMRRNSSLDR
ncbi:hypothetical protein D9M73_46620 [compost metagenome]